MMQRRYIVLLLVLAICVLPLAQNFSFVPHQTTTYQTIDVLKPVQQPNGTWSLASAGSDYVDARDSILYGTTTTDPPSGAGNPDLATTDCLEGSFTEDSYTTLHSWDMTTFPPTDVTVVNFIKVTSGGQSGAYADITRAGGTPTWGQMYCTSAHALSSYVGARISFYYRQQNLAAGNYYVQSFEGGGYITVWQCPAGTVSTWTSVTIDRAYTGVDWKVLFYVTLSVDGKGAELDTVLLQGKTTSTYYRFECVFRFDSIDWNSYVLESLYVNVASASSSETLTYYGGTSSNPTTAIKTAQAGNTNWTVDIHPTLTGTPYYLRIVDVSRSGDSSQSTWKFCQLYILLTDTAPVNNAASCTNLDDGMELYARYRYYTFVTKASDADGYSGISTMDLSLGLAPSTIYWTARYTQTSNTFSETVGTNYIDLSTSSSSAARSGTWCNVTFSIKLEWAHPYFGPYDLKLVTTDTDSQSDTDWLSSGTQAVYATLWLPSTAGPTLNDGVGAAARGTIGGNVLASGAVDYGGSGMYFNNRHPPANETDIWVTCPDVAAVQATNYEATGGTFSATVSAASTVKQSTYSFKAVTEGSGSGGSNLFYSTPTATYIADQEKVQWVVSNSTYNELSHSILLTVGLKYAYDNATVTTGTFSLKYGSTYLTLAHLLSENWTVLDSSAVSASRTYSAVNGSDTTYGISSIDMNSKSVTCHWSRILLTVTVNHGWTVIGYNTTITVTGTYEGLGYKWNGTATFNSTWDAPFYPTFSTASNRSFVVTSITNTDMNLVGFSANTVYCTWDSIYPTTSIAMYWSQYSATQVNLIWGTASYWKWVVNGTWIPLGVILHSRSNGSVPESYGAIYNAVGGFGGMNIGFYTPSWYHLNLTVNCEVTVSGISYDWQVWGQVLSVNILHSLQIVSFSLTPTDYYLWIQYQTSLMNASITIWDDFMDSGTLFADRVYYSTLEGMHQIPLTGAGTHNLTFCITSTGIQYDKNFTVGDYVWWYNLTYVIDPQVFMVSDIAFLYSITYFQFSGYVNLACNWHLYRFEALMSSGTFSAGSFSQAFYASWFEAGTTGIQACNLKFVNGATTRWFNASYYVNPTILAITDTSYTSTSTENHLSGVTNLACNYYVYDNNTYQSVSGSMTVGSFSITWNKLTAVGLHRSAIKFNVTGTTRWWNGSYDVSSTTFLVTDTFFALTIVEARLVGYVNLACTDTIYDNNSLRKTESLAAGSFSVFSPTLPATGLHIWAVKFTSGSIIRWVNASYYVSGLAITNRLALAQEYIVSFSGTTSLACSVIVYEYGTAVASAVIPQAGEFSLWWNRTVGHGSITATLFFYTATSNVTIPVTYAKLTELNKAILDAIGNLAIIIADLGNKMPSSPQPIQEVTADIWLLIFKILIAGVIVLILAIILVTVIRAVGNDRASHSKEGKKATPTGNPAVFIE